MPIFFSPKYLKAKKEKQEKKYWAKKQKQKEKFQIASNRSKSVHIAPNGSN